MEPEVNKEIESCRKLQESRGNVFWPVHVIDTVNLFKVNRM